MVAYCSDTTWALQLAQYRAQSNPKCRTKPSRFDPVYPPHLRGLPKVRSIKKKKNFLLFPGLELV